MNILDYIKGKRQGKEANRLEKEAMRDPFLREALEGYEPFDDGLADDIAFLQSQVMEKATTRKRIFALNRKRLAIAASYTVLVVGSFLIYLFMNKNDDKMLVMSDQETQEMMTDEPSLDDYDTISSSDLAMNAVPEKATIQYTAPEIVSADEMTEEETLMCIDMGDMMALKIVIGESEKSANLYKAEIADYQQGVADKEVVAELRANAPSSKQRDTLSLSSQIAARFDKLVCPDLRGRVTVSFSINANGEPGVIHAAGTQCEAFERELRRVLKDLGDLSGNTERIVLELDF